MAKDGYYKMQVDKGKKTIDMTVSGSFTPEKAAAFVEDYQKTLVGLTTEEFTLKFDCRDLEVVTPEMVPVLESCLKLYKDTGFEKVEIGIKKSPIIKMQLGRLGRNVGLANLEVLEIY